ncbi:NLR family CARD domain-containing protein 4 [Rhinophrynus dorsalis]
MNKAERETPKVNVIRKNYVELIKRMGRTIAMQIVSDLYAINILSIEEMDGICSSKVDQDLARTLINGILKKGEASCNYFLQFLQKHDRYFFEDVIGESDMATVTEEHLTNLSEYLKRLYIRPYFTRFYPLGEETGIDILFDLDTTFTDPLLWKKDTLNRRRKQLTLVEMLDELESPCVIEGEAGKGKTTILKRIAMLWASGKCTALESYKLVFFVTLRSTGEGLYETLCDQLFAINFKFNKKEFMQEIWKLGRNVLFLLDGYDEFQSESCREIEELIKQNPKFNSTVIVSTRTETIGKLRQCGALIAETSDFTVDNAEQLIGNVLFDDEAKGLLSQLKESDFMKSLMKTPLFVVIACALRMGESDFQMNTQTALFCTLYDLMVKKSMYKMKHLSEDIISANILHFGDLAIDGLFEHKFDFHEEHLSCIKEDILLNIGLLNKYTAQRRKPVYRFFHKSFQEYTAGRRLSELLSSEEPSDVIKGKCYLSKINSLYDITTKYSNLLLYTCGSSKAATRRVVQHIAEVNRVHTNYYNTEIVEFGINLFYESSTKEDLQEEFKSLFSDKSLYLNTHNIASHHVAFFQHLPNCLSALNVIKLDFFGSDNNSSENAKDINTGNGQSKGCNHYIPNKAVELFFDWRQDLQTLEVTLKDFDKLHKQDIKYLGKICSSAERLKLNIKRSWGITGTLTGVLESCKKMQDLIIDSTPLSIEDERRIVELTDMKTLSISNLQSEHQPDGLLTGLCMLINIEKLIFHNIKLNENEAQILAKGISSLNRLRILNLSHISNIGNAMEHIAESIALYCHELEDLKLTNCCLTGNALKTLSYNLNKLLKLKVLDLSGNYLESDGTQSVEALALSLTNVPTLTELLLPGGTDVKRYLDALLLQLKTIPTLTKLAFKRWNLKDVDMRKLAMHLENGFEKLSFLDLSDNCATSDGWISLIDVLENLKNLNYFNCSTECIFDPDPDIVRKLSLAISRLQFLCTLELNNWELDYFDLDEIKKAKNMIHRPGKTNNHFFQVSNMEINSR